MMPVGMSPNSPLRIAIVSTPRSGNTWLRRLLATAYNLIEQAKHDPRDFEWENLAEGCVYQIHWHPVETFLSLLDHYRFKVIVLCRHPMDVLISILHFAPFEPETACWLDGEGGTEESILAATPSSPEFISYAIGPRAGALLSVSQEWWHQPGIIRCRYEKLVQNPQGELRRVVNALDRPISDDAIDIAIQSNSLERLRRTSKNNHFWKGSPGIWKQLIPAPQARSIWEVHSGIFHEFGYMCDPDVTLDLIRANANWFRLY